MDGKWPIGYEWMNLRNLLLYTVPIFNEQSSVSAQLQLALEDSSGSLLTEAFRLINCPHRVGERQEEGTAKCSHVYPPSEDPLLRAHSLSSLALFFLHLNSHTLSFITDLQVNTCCCSEQLQVQWLKETVASPTVFSGTLQGLGFPAEQ